MAKAVGYSGDRHRFGLVCGWAEVVAGLAFLAAGGLGIVERAAHGIAAAFGGGAIAAGVAFFAILGLLTALFELPFDLYATFRIEERHGFNRQTLGGFLLDRVKSAGIAIALGGPMVALVLWLMGGMGPTWWLWAWGVTTAFGLLAAWIYPTVLAPLFNTFTPLPNGELKDAILDLARRTGFRAGGISVMDASRRTAHGNAYFTGVFGQKRIVLFDTLLQAMGPREVVAVLAHELGHFKLHHVRWAMVRGTAASGLVFFALSRCLRLDAFYAAFSVERTAYGALAVFGLWFGLVSFLVQPLGNALSRRHEFAADAFALGNGASATELGSALRKLREKSRLLPVTHPLYSRVYHSHPPLLERLRAMGAPESS
jgi:STE24 endopeptidase